MPPIPICVLIELDPGAEPISGTLRLPPRGPTTDFCGWLALTETIEAIRRANARPAGKPGRHAGVRAPNSDRRTSPPGAGRR